VNIDDLTLTEEQLEQIAGGINSTNAYTLELLSVLVYAGLLTNTGRILRKLFYFIKLITTKKKVVI
jgi:hypothetical protein